MQQLSFLREHVSTWRDIESRTRDTLELTQLADDESDGDLIAEIERDAQAIATDLAKLEFQLMLSGPHDRNDAILAIHAGAGGTDSQDWAEMLLRMFSRWSESHRFKIQVIDSLSGEEAGLKRAMVSIEGPYAYGYLRSERGVHRLVRLSPFDAAHRRHTSFALVEVWPDIQDDIEVEIKPDDIEVEVFSASGPGGQHMQKNATAVRIVHKPSGLVVACESQRSLTQNRLQAMAVLRSRLYDIEEQKRLAERKEARRSQVGSGDRSEKIRTYNFPQNRVTDHRIGVSVYNLDSVLDGELDMFIDELATTEEAERLQSLGE
jgi:peptide chain release factor 2